MLKHQQASSIPILNECTTTDHSLAPNAINPFRSNGIVHTAACHTAYIEIPRRHATYATWPNENLPSVDDLVSAGFFYTGTKTIVTCFYCNGSLQNWGANDNPIIEHARWFPHCGYAKQLCGAELYRKIQESKRAQHERAKANDTTSCLGISGNNSSHGRLLIPDESTLSRIVAARLVLKMSQSLLDQNFKLSIIKRCWEDQIRLKRKTKGFHLFQRDYNFRLDDDFVSDGDLLVACMILQKQIEHIDGKKENIIVPSVTMKKIREREDARNLSRSRVNVDSYMHCIGEAHPREQAASGSSSTNVLNNNDVEMAPLSESIPGSTASKSTDVTKEKQEDNKSEKANISRPSKENSSLP
ncbi:unnamed protein product, partial [Rotaria sp. Silwood1]